MNGERRLQLFLFTKAFCWGSWWWWCRESRQAAVSLMGRRGAAGRPSPALDGLAWNHYRDTMDEQSHLTTHLTSLRIRFRPGHLCFRRRQVYRPLFPNANQHLWTRTTHI